MKIQKVLMIFPRGLDSFLSHLVSAKRATFSYLCLLSVIASIFFALNPSNMRHEYGDMYGKYDERGDSYAEFLVRNTIKNEILGTTGKGFFLINTKGYSKPEVRDLDYYSDGITKHFSGLYIHGYIASKIAVLFNLQDEKSIDRYIFILRMLHAFLLTLCVLSFCNYISFTSGLNGFIITPVMTYITMFTYGYILFAQHIYYAFALYLLPLLFFSYVHKIKQIYLIMLGIFILSYFRTLCSFSHLPPFCIMIVWLSLTTYPAIFGKDFTLKDSAFIIKVCCTTIFGVLCGLITFYLLYIRTLSTILSFASLKNAFIFLKDGQHVDWIPTSIFSEAFIQTMANRLEHPALVFWPSSFILSEKDVFVILGCFFLIALFRIKSNYCPRISFLILGGCIAGYASMYIIALRYMMIHGHYDWPLFAITIMLSFNAVIIVYASTLLKFIQQKISTVTCPRICQSL